MLELIATSIITVSSALLFGYWYRYTCLLILSAKTTKDYAGEVAAANHLSFSEIQAQLAAGSGQDLDLLQQSLNRDYARLTALFESVSSAEVRLEDRMLQLDYVLMSVWYSVSRHFSVRLAQSALEEMSQVVEHFANSLGERTAGAEI
jgi:hypothetical protein